MVNKTMCHEVLMKIVTKLVDNHLSERAVKISHL